MIWRRFALFTPFLFLFASGCSSQQGVYHSPDIAVESFIAALRSEDSEPRLREVFGPDAEKLISSGDPVADRNARQKFLAAFDRNHELVEEEDGSMTLHVGAQDWPFPVPIVKKSRHEWFFDTAAGEDEIISRRIGRNELDAMQVCLAIVDAQREYSTRDPDNDGIAEYAAKFASDPGTRNGLYWPVQPGEQPSPLGPLVVEATDEGYLIPESGSEPQPYHGYFYRMLTSQGPGAPGGAYDYIVNGQQIGGFAVVAHPAQYGNSGIMSFIVNQDGVVYQKDLGPNTANLARLMTAYDPSDGWTKSQ